ncbi:hypothetical protein JXJ21_16260, partial [candidate division KSB1 bacterium]|nr:hypothetical protein [candidate division KSB1 bacterium]
IEDKRKAIGYDKSFPIQIMSTPGTGEQSIALYNFVVEEMKFPADSVTIIFTKGSDSSATKKNAAVIEQLIACGVDTTHRPKRIGIDLDPDYTLSNDQTVFLITRRGKSAKSLPYWRLIVEKADQVVKSIEGDEDIDKITWDWNDNYGNLIGEGTYFYYLQWRDNKSSDWKPDEPRKKPIFVDKREVSWRLFLTKDGHVKYIQDKDEEAPVLEPVKIEILVDKNKEKAGTEKKKGND